MNEQRSRLRDLLAGPEMIVGALRLRLPAGETRGRRRLRRGLYDRIRHRSRARTIPTSGCSR